MLAHAAEFREHRRGDVVIRQGELATEAFILIAGECSIHVEDGPYDDDDGYDVPAPAGYLQPGDSFGELALIMESQRRSATIVACSECVWLLAIPKNFYLAAAEDDDSFESTTKSRANFLCNCPVFERMGSTALHALSYVASVHEYDSGTILAREGSVSDQITLVWGGTCTTFKRVHNKRNQFAVTGLLRKHSVFGQDSALHRKPQSASVVASTAVTVLQLSRFDLSRRMDRSAHDMLLACHDEAELYDDDVLQSMNKRTQWEHYKTSLVQALAPRAMDYRTIRGARSIEPSSVVPKQGSMSIRRNSRRETDDTHV